MRRLVLTVDGQQRTYTQDDDGLMWRYRTPDGWRWIGWRALAEKFERALDPALDAAMNQETNQ